MSHLTSAFHSPCSQILYFKQFGNFFDYYCISPKSFLKELLARLNISSEISFVTSIFPHILEVISFLTFHRSKLKFSRAPNVCTHQ